MYPRSYLQNTPLNYCWLSEQEAGKPTQSVSRPGNNQWKLRVNERLQLFLPSGIVSHSLVGMNAGKNVVTTAAGSLREGLKEKTPRGRMGGGGGSRGGELRLEST